MYNDRQLTTTWNFIQVTESLLVCLCKYVNKHNHSAPYPVASSNYELLNYLNKMGMYFA